MGCDVTHHGVAIYIDEEVSPSLENTIVYLWLQLINPGLPLIIKQRYGAELCNRSLASLKPDISRAFAFFVDELRTTRAMRSWVGFGYNRKSVSSNRRQTISHKSCVVRKTAGRMSNSYNLIECRYLSDSDKKAMGWLRLLTNDACDETKMRTIYVKMKSL